MIYANPDVKTIELTFDGYMLDEDRDGIDKYAGIYCVYRCTYNINTDKVSLNKLLYIGEADDICGRLSNHERLNDWKKHLRKGEKLCYSYAKIENERLRKQAEAALIYCYKPCENTQHIDSFGYPETKIETFGKRGLLDSELTVKD